MGFAQEELDNRFGFQRPGPEQVAAQERIRVAAREFAKALNDDVGEGRELSLAIGSVEEAMFWALAGIGRAPTRPA